MQETRQMRFEAQKQAVLDQNSSTENILTPMTADVIALIAHDIETAEKMSELVER